MDHVKLAKERDRMCTTTCPDKICKAVCPMFSIKEGRRGLRGGNALIYCNEACMKYPEDAVKAISKWRAENPEPRLPTWREWFLTFLPEVPLDFSMIFENDLAVKMQQYCVYTYYNDHPMNYVLDDPIPADIAEVLKVPMITPKGDAPE